VPLTGQGLAGADSRILENLSEMQTLHRTVSSDALALRLETEAAVGLFFARNPDVTDGVIHGVAPGRATPR
jgi:hypothetical protein